jgi:hypothetical protein
VEHILRVCWVTLGFLLYVGGEPKGLLLVLRL